MADGTVLIFLFLKGDQDSPNHSNAVIDRYWDRFVKIEGCWDYENFEGTGAWVLGRDLLFDSSVDRGVLFNRLFCALGPFDYFPFVFGVR